ncbi:MAG: SDR family oxidoreductase [candidate division Zixibacteria bacterium]|nr:SDR family oxidoreductase [candidate division Zixibacteria bacterium]
MITGGAGFIGSHIVAALLKKGDSVVILDNFSSGRKENLAGLEGAQVVEGDVRDFETLNGLVEGTDTVFHLAAVVSVLASLEEPQTTWEVNLKGTYNVLEAARRARVKRVVYISSSAVYGECPKPPFKESRPPQPESPYALSKLAGEQLCSLYWRLYGLETVALRLFNVYGPRQNPFSQYANAIPNFTRKLLSGQTPTIYGDGNQTRDFVYVGDVVRAAERASRSKKAAGGVFNVGSGKRISVNQLFAEIQKILKTNSKPEFSPRKQGDVLHTWADIARAKKVLGFSPKANFARFLNATVLWFKNSGIFSRCASVPGRR